MKEVREERFEMFLVTGTEIGYFISLKQQTRVSTKKIHPALVFVGETDHCLKGQGPCFYASSHNKYYSVEKKKKVEDPATLRENLLTE